MIEIFLRSKDDDEEPELPEMTEWSSELIDAVSSGDDVSHLMPYSEWKNSKTKNKHYE